MNGYQFTKAFYDRLSECTAMQEGVSAHHHSLYTWVCELYNRHKINVLDLPRDYTMKMAFIGSPVKFKKCLDDLVKWEILEYVYIAVNQWQTTKVRFAGSFLNKHRTSNEQASNEQDTSNELASNTIKRDKRAKETKEKKAPPLSPQGVEVASMLASFKYQSDAFRLAWQEWEQYRKESQKPLRPTSVFKQLKQLESVTEAQAIAMIEQSIKNGWQGLFDLKSDAQPRILNAVPQPSLPTNKPYRELV